MRKLRKKILKQLLNRSYSTQLLADDLEQITDDFAVKFAKWLIESPDTSMAVTEYTYTELLQIFKEKYYL